MDLVYFAIWYALGFISFAIITFKISTFTKGDLFTAFMVSFMGLFVAVVAIMERFSPGWWDELLFKKKKPTERPIEHPPVMTVKKNTKRGQNKTKRKPNKSQR